MLTVIARPRVLASVVVHGEGLHSRDLGTRTYEVKVYVGSQACANGGVTTPCVAIMTSVERDAVANKAKQKLNGDILGNPYILLKPAVSSFLGHVLLPDQGFSVSMTFVKRVGNISLIGKYCQSDYGDPMWFSFSHFCFLLYCGIFTL
jgi:hypothetical protein